MSYGNDAKTRTVTVKWVIADNDRGYAEVLRIPCVGEGFVFQDGSLVFNVVDVVHYSADEDERKVAATIHLANRLGFT